MSILASIMLGLPPWLIIANISVACIWLAGEWYFQHD